MTSAPNPAVSGQPVTLTATVAVVAPGGGPLTGSVTFFDGATSLGSAPVTDGSAALAVSDLASGSHSITATYSGDVNMAESTSPAIELTVNLATRPAGYAPLSPARVLDSRADGATVDGRFIGGGPLVGGTVFELDITDRAGVPPGASAVSLNVTVTEPIASGFLTVFPCGTTRPNASSLNFVAGQTVPNAVLAKIGDNGTICLFAQVATHVIVDVNGYFAADAAFAAVAPGRVLDSRADGATVDGRFVAIGALAAGTILELDIVGRAGVPSGASAVSLNVTVTEPAAAGFLTVFPCGTTRPNASSLNFVAGQTVPNA
ncbi:MAG: Ig-like domain repeat protein, partial [Actinobacteria bacterium]|nr:Ig-like domain repeat protein [Actinomycetota bacterium]